MHGLLLKWGDKQTCKKKKTGVALERAIYCTIKLILILCAALVHSSKFFA